MHRMMIALTAAASLLLVACGGGAKTPPPTTPPPAKPVVVVTTTQLADFAKVIGGDDIELYSILKPNISPHNYKLTAADITAIARADLIFKSGVGLDAWLEDSLESADHRGPVVDTSSGVVIRMTGEGVTKQEKDPHIWHSPLNTKLMVANIRQALVTTDPAHADNYRLNERSYDAQLDALANELRQALGSMSSKKIVTSHESLGYFCDEFGLEYVGFTNPGIATQSEPTAAQMTSLVNTIKAENVKAVFAESSFPPRTAEAVASQAKVTVVAGKDTLYADSLGAPGSNGDTYLKAQRHNANVLVETLR